MLGLRRIHGFSDATLQLPFDVEVDLCILQSESAREVERRAWEGCICVCASVREIERQRKATERCGWGGEEGWGGGIGRSE